MAALSGEREKLIRTCKRRDDQIVNLKHEIAEVRSSYQEAVEAPQRTTYLRWRCYAPSTISTKASHTWLGRRVGPVAGHQ